MPWLSEQKYPWTGGPPPDGQPVRYLFLTTRFARRLDGAFRERFLQVLQEVLLNQAAPYSHRSY